MNSTACEMAEILSKTIETFLGLNLFTDIYTLCSCIDESQKDKKVEAHQNWVGKIVLKFNKKLLKYF